jgi:Cd2+/Zn2+-exporting ATPase
LAGLLVRAVEGFMWLEIGLALIAYAAGGTFGLSAGIKSLREGQINVDLLMILAALGAAFIGSWPEGATLLFLFSLSNVLQEYAMDRSRQAIRKLLDLRPGTATVRREGEEVDIDVEQLQIGEIVIVRPGERIAVDGVVTTGTSSVDQSSITGESIPVEKTTRDIVFAGTINQHGALEVRVSKHAADSTLARIIRLVEEAQGQKAPTQRFIDTFEQYYAMIVIAGVAVFIAVSTLLAAAHFPRRSTVLWCCRRGIAVCSRTPATSSAPLPTRRAKESYSRAAFTWRMRRRSEWWP